MARAYDYSKKENRSVYYNVKGWGKLAERLAAVEDGTQVALAIDRISTEDAYENKEGKTISKFSLNIQDFAFIPKAADGDGAGGSSSTSTGNKGPARANGPANRRAPSAPAATDDAGGEEDGGDDQFQRYFGDD